MLWIVLVPATLGLGVASVIVATQNSTRIHNTTDRTFRGTTEATAPATILETP